MIYISTYTPINRSITDIKTLQLIIGLILFSILFSCTTKLKKVNSTFVFPANPINICIDSSRSFIGPCEPSICINPRDNSKLVAGSVLTNVYYSHNGGYTWEKDYLTSTHGVYGDPVIAADNKGNFYYAHLSKPNNTTYSDSAFLDRIVVQKSMDNGENWNNGSHTAPNNKTDHDKHWLAIDMNTNELFMTWTEFDQYDSDDISHRSRILFSTSADGATTWSSPQTISDITGDCLDDDGTTEGAVPAIGPNGEVYVSWALDNKIYFDMSKDKGQTWLDKDKVIADQPGGWALDIPGIMRCNGMPITGVDISSSKYNGTIYVNWSDQRYGKDDTDIWIVKSTNNGKSWSQPKRVNDDKPGKHQFFSWMDIDPITGYIYIVFYDRRAHTDETTDVYIAYSTDGGDHFTNKKINKQSFKPNSLAFFGDYNDISAYNGTVRPIWTVMDKNRLSVWTAIINIAK